MKPIPLRRSPFAHASRLLVLVSIILIATPLELAARGGRGGGRGGFGGYSRGGIARNGGISRSPRSYPSTYPRSQPRPEPRPVPRSEPRPGGSRSRDGSFETRTGNTVDWESEVTRGEDGLERNTSWESTSGASGSGSSTIRRENGQVQVDRTRHAESASGETIDRSWTAEREGDWIVREGDVKTSTGVNADTATAIRKTDDGFVVQGAGSGSRGDYAGTIVKSGDDVYGRGVRVKGDDVTWGRIHCDSGRCTGGRVTADLDDYYGYPYYYYPYYYGWYSCPGHVDTWHGAYGTPVYGCSNTVVVSTTLSLGGTSSGSTSSAYASDATRASASGRTSTSSGSDASTDSRSKSASPSRSGAVTPASTGPAEAHVTSQPVLMYELAPDLVVYSADKKPRGVHSVKHGARYFWAPGPTDASSRTDDWIRRASGMKAPTANATVITYTIGDQLVYLTNEKPSPGYFSESSDQLYAWMPGVQRPNEAQKEAIGTAIAAHRAGGRQALDREVRKLEQRHAPPPSAPSASSSPSATSATSTR